MDIHATLRRSGGIDALARHLALTPAQGAVLVRDLLPHALAVLRAHLEGAAEGSALFARLGTLGGSRMAVAILGAEPIAEGAGERVIGGLIGDADAGAAIIERARRHSTVPAATLAAGLPLVLMLVGGYLAARAETAGDPIAGEITGLLAGDDPLRR